jgi:hypothetical protein
MKIHYWKTTVFILSLLIFASFTLWPLHLGRQQAVNLKENPLYDSKKNDYLFVGIEGDKIIFFNNCRKTINIMKISDVVLEPATHNSCKI